MRMHRASKFLAIVALIALPIGSLEVRGQGIPLPGITLYGVVLNEAGTLRLTSGLLSMTYTPTGGGAPIVVETQLADLSGLFSYVVNVPVEIPIEGLSTSTGAIALPSAGVTYTRSANVGGTALAFAPGETQSTLTPDQHRGVVQRLDMRATGLIAIPEDLSGDGRVTARDDLLMWFQAWMDTTPIEYNFDGQGKIDARDLLRLLKAIKAD